VVERNPGEWFCIVASDEYDYDFDGDYTVYGPKNTYNEALEEMHQHESNPGGCSIIPHDRITPYLISLIDNLRCRFK
jgi:hypothetical protein